MKKTIRPITANINYDDVAGEIRLLERSNEIKQAESTLRTLYQLMSYESDSSDYGEFEIKDKANAIDRSNTIMDILDLCRDLLYEYDTLKYFARG